MTASEQLLWTLPQAAAWVMFRDMATVDRFSPPAPQDWKAFLAYPTMRPDGHVLGATTDLFDAIRAGKLTALGRRPGPGSMLEEIAVFDWQDLIPDVDGPYRRNVSGGREEPWRDIRVKRADLERLWRRPSEIEGRSRHPKAWFQQRFSELRESQPGLSKNELITELQGQFCDETNRPAPSRTTIQRYIKSL
jgi:hypothetical protein